MRTRVFFGVFMAILTVLDARADHKSAPIQDATNGQQVDERERLAHKLLETSQSLSWAQVNQKDRCEIQFKLSALVHKLRYTSLPLAQIGLDDVRDLQRKFSAKETEARENLIRVRGNLRQSLATVAQYRKAGNSLIAQIPKDKAGKATAEDEGVVKAGKRLLDQARRFEANALQLAAFEAKLTPEVRERETLSGFITSIVRELPPSPKKTQRAKK